MNVKYSLFALVSVCVLAVSCGRTSEEAMPAETATYDSIVRAAHTRPVTEESEVATVRLNGKIQPSEMLMSKVYSLVSGKTEAVYVELGDYVKKGQVLAVLQSTEMAAISNDLTLARSGLAAAKRNLETVTDLRQGNLATEQEYLNARVAHDNAVSELQRAEQVVSITGGQSARYPVTAPITGFVIEKHITGGSELRSDNNDNLFTVADLSTVWIIAHVYEADMNRISVGDSVKVTTLVNPDKSYPGTIDKIYNVLDPETRTMPVRVTMQNPQRDLKPEMFATIVVQSKSPGQRLTIPSRAIVMDNSKNYVVTRHDNALAIREVALLRRVGDKAYITGLSLGEEVVVDDSVFLYQALLTNH